MSKKILVTGGAGYIGSVCVPKLLNEGYEVTVVDNLMYKQESLLSCFSSSNFKFVKGDVRDNSLMSNLLKNADCIIPLAAIVGAPACARHPDLATSTNYDAVQSMLKMLGNDQQILMPTTNSAYGSGNNENYCDENSPLNPISQYAVEKVEVEKMLLEKENVVSLRLATVFGLSPRMRLDLLVNDFTFRAFKDRFIVLFEEHFKRNYIHVEDIANVFSHCLNNFDTMRGEVFNVGLSEANLSKRELCEKISSFVEGFTIMSSDIGKDPDQRNYIVSNDKIEATGFKPSVSLESGIKNLLEGFSMLNSSHHANV